MAGDEQVIGSAACNRRRDPRKLRVGFGLVRRSGKLVAVQLADNLVSDWVEDFGTAAENDSVDHDKLDGGAITTRLCKRVVFCWEAPSLGNL